MRAKVLIIDDEEAIRSSLKMILEYEGYDCVLAANGEAGLKIAEREIPDLVFLDIKMPQVDGMEVLKRLKATEGSPPVVMISGHADVATAFEASKLGAFDFLEKPLESERVLVVSRNALGQKTLERENRRLKLAFEDKYRMVGRSTALDKVGEAIKRAAPTNATVLIVGESGVGKELVARAIHRNSLRKDEAFVQVNCAAIPEELIEIELFGYFFFNYTATTEKIQGKAGEQRRTRCEEGPAQRLIDRATHEIGETAVTLSAALLIFADAIEHDDLVVHRIADKRQQRRDHIQVDFTVRE